MKTINEFRRISQKLEIICQDIYYLYGSETAENLFSFARKISVETTASYIDVMPELKRLMKITKDSVKSANLICKQYRINPNDYITWEEKPVPIGTLNIFKEVD